MVGHWSLFLTGRTPILICFDITVTLQNHLVSPMFCIQLNTASVYVFWVITSVQDFHSAKHGSSRQTF